MRRKQAISLTRPLQMSEAAYRKKEDEHIGICRTCKTEKGGVEGDAEGYPCDYLGRLLAAAPQMRDMIRSLADAAFNCGQSTKPEYFSLLRQLEEEARALLKELTP